MSVSLAFHILFAVTGMAMPLLMVLSEWRYLRTRDEVYLDLAKRWAKGTAILFAVGAVSGTVLSFELGLLWPVFMGRAGPSIGLPFGLEGFAFFLESIFLGIYLYGWDRVSPRVHLVSGAVIAVSGLLSGVFVVAVNSWMNAPTGFSLEGGVLSAIDPWGPFESPAFPEQAAHMAIAAYASVGFAVLGIHAARLLKDPNSRFHRAAFQLAFFLAVFSAPLQLVTGDAAARNVAARQPEKLAAAEALFHTAHGAALSIGGWTDGDRDELVGALQIPGGLSVLLHGDPSAEVRGLDVVPSTDRPPVAIVHFAFDVMVGAGMLMIGLVLAGSALLLVDRRRWPQRPLLWALVAGSPLGLIAIEAGWTVTEVGRQPWVVRGVLRTQDAVTPMPHLIAPFLVTTLLYLFLGVVVIVLLRAHVFSVPTGSGDAR
jgi:cytochrome d ubiquinol oxidase subunit I